MTNELVKFTDVYHHVNQRDLFFDLTGTIYDTDKIGLIGQNGTGKTTFLKMITGEIKPYKGQVEVETKNIGYIPQIIDTQLTEETQTLSIYDFCMYLNNITYEDYKFMSKYENGESTDDVKYLECLGNFQENGGYDYQKSINTMLSIAGLPEETYSQVFQTLSEGQKRLIYIISMMALSKDLLIMDEPTNHVDTDLKQKYIKLIKEYRGAILVVSHDRELLQQACNRIWEIEDKLLHTYNGNWEFYQAEHEMRLKSRVSDYKNTEKEVARLEDYLNRIARGQSQGSLTSTRKKIEREKSKLERVPPKIKKDTIKAKFSYEGKYSQYMLRFIDFSLYLNEELRIKDLNFELMFGQKIAIKGSNGTGKSTIVKLILEKCDYARYTGEVKVGESAQIGYFSQTLDLGDENVTLIQYIQDFFQYDLTKAHGLMAKYLFNKGQRDQQVFEMSGGEKNRLQLMKLVEGNYNLLILDEPTNHLDIYTIAKLEEILRDFNGSILLISHDKYFVDAVTDEEINLNDYRV